MTPPTGTALLILVAFILPGFVTLLISERTHAVRDTSSAFERLLLALYYSVLTYALLALIGWLAGYNRAKVRHLYKHEQSVGKILLFAFLAILVIPSFIATVSRLWLKTPWRRWLIGKLRINPRHSTPTAWDHFFEQGKEAFVRVTLSDGRVVGGYYGPGSFATRAHVAKYDEALALVLSAMQWERGHLEEWNLPHQWRLWHLAWKHEIERRRTPSGDGALAQASESRNLFSLLCPLARQNVR